MSAIERLQHLLKFKRNLLEVPDTTYGGHEVIKALNKSIHHAGDAAINARGAAAASKAGKYTFRRIRGRIIPILVKAVL